MDMPCDKLTRFVACLIMCQVASKLLGTLPVENFIAVSMGFCIACVISIVNIFVSDDEFKGSDLDSDLAVTIFGAFVGALLSF